MCRIAASFWRHIASPVSLAPFWQVLSCGSAMESCKCLCHSFSCFSSLLPALQELALQSTIIDEQQQVISRLHMATHHLASNLLNSTQSIYQEWEARLPALRSGALLQDVGLQIQPINLGQALGGDQSGLLPMVVMPTTSLPQGARGKRMGHACTGLQRLVGALAARILFH
jgi:hypothetical protein